MADTKEVVKYVEVPVFEDVVRHVPKKEYVQIETLVPKYEYETVEKVVEVPKVQIVEKIVDVRQVEEVIRRVPVKQVIDIPKEVINYIPRIETKIIEKTVEVPGEVVEVQKPYTVENTIIVPRYLDEEVPTVVSQTFQPQIVESKEEKMEVRMREYDPYLVPVDVFIPRPVHRKLIPGNRHEQHKPTSIPPAQYNALIRSMNSALNDKDVEGLYFKMGDGSIPMSSGAGSALVKPHTAEWQSYRTPGEMHVRAVSLTHTKQTTQ